MDGVVLGAGTGAVKGTVQRSEKAQAQVLSKGIVQHSAAKKGASAGTGASGKA